MRPGRSGDWAPAGAELTLFDDEPFVSLKLADPRAGKLTLAPGWEELKLEKEHRPAGDKDCLYWSPFNIKGLKDISRARRIGDFRLAVKHPQHDMVVHLRSRLILAEPELLALIEDLTRHFSTTAWESAHLAALGVARGASPHGPTPAGLAGRELDGELRAAETLLEQALLELRPWRPGAPRLPLHPDYTRGEDGPEHRLVQVWAQDTLDLLRRGREQRAMLERYVQEARGAPGFVDALGGSHLKAQQELARLYPEAPPGVEARVLRLLQRLDAHGRAWAVPTDPSVRRNPHAQRLLSVLAPAAARYRPELLGPGLRSTLTLRLFPELFERWVAFLLVDLLLGLGMEAVGPPHVNAAPVADGLPELPLEIEWRFRWRGSDVLLMFQVPARRAERRPRGSPKFEVYEDHVSRWARANAPSRRLVTRRSEVQPDLVLIVQTAHGVAFAVGDVTCSDFRQQNSLEAAHNKLAKLAHGYQLYLRLVGPGGALVGPSPRSAFVAWAGARGTWASREGCAARLEAVEAEADELDVHPLWLAPGESCREEAQSWLAQLVEKLYLEAVHDYKA